MDDRGDSLIEILVAVVIMGIAFAAIIGGFGVSIKGSSVHEDLADAQRQVRNAAEQIKAATFTGCAGVGVVSNYTATADSGFHVDVSIPLIWDNSSGSYVTATVTNCLTAQLQKMTVTTCRAATVVAGTCPSTTSASLVVTKRAS